MSIKVSKFEQEAANEPSTSDWLKEQFQVTKGRDIVDAINDAEALLFALKGRLEIQTKAYNGQHDDYVWRDEFPTESGHYVWREIGSTELHPELAKVTVDKEGVFVKFHPTLSPPEPIADIAQREWLKIRN